MKNNFTCIKDMQGNRIGGIKVNVEEINKAINELRDTLNILMIDNYRDNYENILELSVKLDCLISLYIKSKNKKI